MADPTTLAVIAGVQKGLQPILSGMPAILHEAHDASTRRGLRKLNALFLKAQMGDFTEEDFKQAKYYYAKIEAVALISQNQMMLSSLKEGLALLKTTLVLKDVLDKKPETDASTIEIPDPKTPVVDILDVGGAITETGESPGLSDDEISLNPSSRPQTPPSRATDRTLAELKALERPAVWCMVAVMPYLLFVPKIRRKC